MAGWENAPVVDSKSEDQKPAWASASVVEPASGGEVGAGRSLLRGINDGLTFGFADEISSSASAALNPLLGTGNDGDTWRERYDLNVEGERALDRQSREQNPVASTVGGISGGLLPMAMTGGASLLPSATKAASGPLSRAASQSVPSLKQAAVEGSAIGAGYGGLYGLGTAEGDLLERAPAAAEGAAIGAVVGAGVPVALSAGKAAIGTLRSPDRSAIQQVERAVERDGMTMDQFRRQSEELQQRYPGTAMPADAGGENVQGLVERVAQTPGAGRSQVIPALTERQQGQPQRITDTLQELTNSERDSFNRAAEDLGRATGNKTSAFQAVEEAMAQRSRDAQPLYAKAYQEPVPWSHELEDLFKRPVMQEAYRAASRRAGNEGRDFYGKFIDLKDDGTFTAQSVPSTGDLDFIKKTLDSKVGTLERGGDYSEARVIKGIRTKLVDMMDAASPTYRQARSSWAGPSQFIEQVENGRSILSRNISAEELAANLGKLNPSELEGYRIGAVSAIVNKMGNDPSKMADMTKFLRSKEMREKVAAMMPDEAARKRWGDMLDFEVGASGIAGRSLGNSATARRAAEMADADGVGGDLVLSAFAGTPIGSLFSQFITKAGRGLRDSLHARSDQAVADVLTQPGGLSQAQQAAAKAMQPAPPSPLVSGASSVVAAQTAAERQARPTIHSLLPLARELLAEGQADDPKALAQSSGATQAAASRAFYLARKEQDILSKDYSNPLQAKNSLRKSGLDHQGYLIAKAQAGNWQITQRESQQ